MGVKGNAVLGLITLAAFIGCGLMAQAQESQVDYDGFLGLTAEVSEYRASRLVDLDTFNQMKGDPETIILDTRSDSEYCGTTVRAKRAGAIPGAVHIEWTLNLGEDGTFKSASELRAIYESAGVTPDKTVISYCQGGYRAAHSYLALRLLGYPRVRNYVGSWKEWGDRGDLPIETPIRP